MEKVKRIILTALVAVAGLLLFLSGFGLVQLSETLNLYLGIMLLAVAVMLYMLL